MEEIIIFKGTNEELKFNSFYELANELNIKEDTFLNKLAKLKSLQETYNYFLNKNEHENKCFVVFKNTDREFKGTIKEIANHFNISLQTLKNRMKNMSLSLEEAINYNSNKRYFIFKGTDKEFSGTRKGYIKYYFNIDDEKVRKIKNKYNITSFEEAIEKILEERENKFNEKFKINKKLNLTINGNEIFYRDIYNYNLRNVVLYLYGINRENNEKELLMITNANHSLGEEITAIKKILTLDINKKISNKSIFKVITDKYYNFDIEYDNINKNLNYEEFKDYINKNNLNPTYK